MDTARYNAAIAEGLRVLQPVLDRHPTDGPALAARGTLLFRLSRANARREDAEKLRDSAQADLHAAVLDAPHLARAWSTLSRLLQYAGEIAEANTAARRALEEDAYLADVQEIHQRLFRTALDLENYGEAAGWCDRGRHDFPENWRFVECRLAILAFRPGDGARLDSARAILRHLDEVDPPSNQVTPPYRYTYRRVLHTVVLARTDTRAARDTLDDIRDYVASRPGLRTTFDFDQAHLSLLFGDTALALQSISRYLENIPQYRRYVGRSFLFKPLRDDPRFQAIVDGRPSDGGAGQESEPPAGTPDGLTRSGDGALVR
jgi:tetratricopeptide (TPR) repeat protein